MAVAGASNTLLCTLLVASCSLLSPVDACSMSGMPSSLNRLSRTDKGDSSSIQFFNGNNMIGTGSQVNFGSLYEVTIQQQNGKNGGCEEKVIIGFYGRQLEKTLETKCSGNGSPRKIQNTEDFLLIGNPDENFCCFTTNKNEIHYKQDGKWKKGAFSGDNTWDKNLNRAEIAKIEKRIKNWQVFFEKSDKEMQRFRELKAAVREKVLAEKSRIRALKQQEIETHNRNVNQIYNLRTQEFNKHTSERNNIFNRRITEGMSTAVQNLLFDENERHYKKFAELDDIRKEEDRRYGTAMNNYNKQIWVEERKFEEEIRRLDDLQENEERRVMQELKENIKRGW